MRKYLSLFLIVGVLLLAACSNNSEETNEEAASDDAATIETQKELEAMKVEEDKVVATVNDKKIKGKDYNSMLVQTQLRYTMSGEESIRCRSSEIDRARGNG
ncbi:hypothetical protein [Bacillus sp. RAR_GA_16]|uniref:hypothetical protein n=1 Tax=Bacillus sp. RAR_GA_16 TaxID=2876774 RepID=UPI001CCABA11|nr:hypothetical protein [Bacillus sp. RAR_GA_16]MCA0172390.1 hypothetical protein [Bacillus sp. RAR_GA_16]